MGVITFICEPCGVCLTLSSLLRANEEIAEVRSKNKAELSALQAQLRREQLKVQSLEKSLDQKVSSLQEMHSVCFTKGLKIRFKT